MTASLEEKYVTLRALKTLGRGVASFYRRFRWACLAALTVGLIPTIYLVYSLATTGFPQSFWGPLGKVTTLPGYLLLEGVLGHDVPLATTGLTYNEHVERWLTMLVANFFCWLLVFVAVTAVVRLLLRNRASPA